MWVWNAFSTARLGTLGFDLLRGRRSMARLTNSMSRTGTTAQPVDHSLERALGWLQRSNDHP